MKKAVANSQAVSARRRSGQALPADVADVFDTYAPATRASLLAVRDLVFETADRLPAIGPLTETLKWGQPAYLPVKLRTGTTVRIDALKQGPHDYAVYFHCQTNLVAHFREIYQDVFVYEGDRALHFANAQTLPRQALSHCIARALTYHLKRGGG